MKYVRWLLVMMFPAVAACMAVHTWCTTPNLDRSMHTVGTVIFMLLGLIGALKTRYEWAVSLWDDRR